MQDPLEMKGIREGILVTANTNVDWAAILLALTTRIDNQLTFFKGASLVLSLDTRAVQRGELEKLHSALMDRGVQLACVLSESAMTRSAAQQLDIAVDLASVTEQHRVAASQLNGIEQPQPFPEQMFDSTVHGSGGILIKQTLRSGRMVRSTGHVIVIGDVNPGAEVIAGGDIVIWGKARGMVHAGAMGDETSVICALELQPTQLRIASHISISPPKGRRRRPRPERALVREGQIEAETWEA
jgi:septum site-determining protein MinC